LNAARRQAPGLWLAFGAVALLLACVLRSWQLGTQILIDDEWHALHKLLQADAADIATHFGFADYSIPLTLYYRFLYLHGGLSEWGMHLPLLLAGIAAVVLLPWLLRREAPPATLALWSALLAIAPFLVYHSRTARPYALTALLVLVALFAFRRWWLQRDGRSGLTYALCAGFAAWLHLITLPFTLLPFIFFGLAPLAGRDGRERGASARWRGVRRLILLGLATAALLALALAPPLATDFAALAGKSGGGTVALDTVWRALLLAAGVGQSWLGAIVLLFALLGAANWARRDAAFVGYLAFVVCGAAAAVAVSHAAWVQHPGTFARYLQPAIPLLLLFAAEGLAGVLRPCAPPLQAALGAAAIAALLALGPIPAWWYAPNQFMTDPYFQFDYDPAHNPYRTELPDGPIPDFYRRLRAWPAGTLTLIEAPWSLETDHDPQPLYQRVHRQNIRIGLTSPLCGVRDYGDFAPTQTGLRFVNFVHLDAVLDGAGGGDLLVLHRHAWPASRPAPPQWPDEAACLAAVEQRLGTPGYEDPEIAVFGLSEAGRAALVAPPEMK